MIDKGKDFENLVSHISVDKNTLITSRMGLQTQVVQLYNHDTNSETSFSLASAK